MELKRKAIQFHPRYTKYITQLRQKLDVSSAA